jgi:hypothetical protein
VSQPDPSPLDCDAAALSRADLGTVDALARLALTARRMGARLVVRNASPELRALLDLAGLVMRRDGSDGALVLELEREAELGEQAVGVQEEREPDDGVV